MRARRSITFPYKIFRGISCPIVTVDINGYKIDAYVDSGAFVSIFSTQEASLLGIDYRQGKSSAIMVGDGNLIPVFLHNLPVRIENIDFHATIGFSPKLGVGFNLLGRKDIFERFIVSFDDRRKLIRFLPNRI